MPASTIEGRHLSACIADPATRDFAIGNIVRALHRAGGVNDACTELGIQRTTLWRWKHTYHTLKLALRDVPPEVWAHGPK